MKDDRNIEAKSPEELTTSEVLMKIGAHYLCNGCNGCDYLEIAKVCDAIPINCKYMALSFYFKHLEEQEVNADGDSD